MSVTRRDLLRTGATVVAASCVGSLIGASACAAAQAQPATQASTQPVSAPATTQSANDRPRFGVIGCGGMAHFHGRFLPKYSDIVAVCDVDRAHAESYNKEFAGGKAVIASDHRRVVERNDIDMVLVATPDHW